MLVNPRLFAVVFTTVFLAELGDKTQLATVFYAANKENPKLLVFLAAAAALVLSSALGVLAGGWISQYVPPRALSYAAGTGFIAVGIWTLARA